MENQDLEKPVTRIKIDNLEIETSLKNPIKIIEKMIQNKDIRNYLRISRLNRDLSYIG